MQRIITLPPTLVTPALPTPAPLPPAPFISGPGYWNGKTPIIYNPADIDRLGNLHTMEMTGPLLAIGTKTQTDIAAHYSAYRSALQRTLNAELADLTRDATGNFLQLNNRELQAIHELISRKHKTLKDATRQSTLFFGRPPLTRSTKQNAIDFVNRLQVRRGVRASVLYQSYIDSLSAAYRVGLMHEAIASLEKKAVALSAVIASAEAEAERIAAEVQRVRKENTFSVTGSAAIGSPLIITAAGAVISAIAEFSLLSAIRAAIAAVAGLPTGFVVGTIAMLVPSRLGNGERPPHFALQTPLAELDPQLAAMLATGAPTAPVALAYRFGSNTDAAGNYEIFAARTDGQVVSSHVPVVAATYDAQRNLYTATTTDTPPRILTWTPVVTPDNASTTLPVEQIDPPVYEGTTLTPVEGRIDSYPDLSHVSWDDYVIVFPADSGLPPLYVMFRDRREEPGTMTGQGQPDAAVWLAGANQGQGVAIPPRIADKLRGRHFPNWRKAREAIWTAVSEDANLMNQFNRSNQATLRDGYAPTAIASEQAGGNQVFQIHHVIPLKDGGEVYDIDNLRITTPKHHIRIHSTRGAE